MNTQAILDVSELLEAIESEMQLQRANLSYASLKYIVETWRGEQILTAHEGESDKEITKRTILEIKERILKEENWMQIISLEQILYWLDQPLPAPPKDGE